MHPQYRLLTLTFLAVGLLIPLATKTADAASIPTLHWPKRVSNKGILVGIIATTALTLYASLKLRKTEPKRVYPKDDSLKEILNFIYWELLVGQKYLPERAAGSHIDPLDPNRTIVDYSKVEARGLTGNTEYYMQTAVIPTIILAAAFKVVKGDILKTWNDIVDWMEKPETLLSITQPAGK